MTRILLNEPTGDQTVVASTAAKQIFTATGDPATFILRADDYDSGTVTLYVRSPEDPAVPKRWVAMASGAFTANANMDLGHIGKGTQIAAALSGSTTPVGLFAIIHG